MFFYTLLTSKPYRHCSKTHFGLKTFSFHWNLIITTKWDIFTYWFMKIHKHDRLHHCQGTMNFLDIHRYFNMIASLFKTSTPIISHSWSLPRLYSLKIYILKCNGQHFNKSILVHFLLLRFLLSHNCWQIQIVFDRNLMLNLSLNFVGFSHFFVFLTSHLSASCRIYLWSLIYSCAYPYKLAMFVEVFLSSYTHILQIFGFFNWHNKMLEFGI